MRADDSTGRATTLFTALASVILAAGLAGCESVHVDGEPAHGGVLNRTVDVVAATAVGFVTAPGHGRVRNAWQDPSGMWHWTRVEPGEGTSRCEGRRLGVPEHCERISPP